MEQLPENIEVECIMCGVLFFTAKDKPGSLCSNCIYHE